MEIASFNKLFGAVRAMLAGLLIGAQPFTPPGRPVFDPGLAGVYAPLQVPAPGGERTWSAETLVFSPDGSGGYRVTTTERYQEHPRRFAGRLYAVSRLVLLDLVPEQDLGWEGMGPGSHLLVELKRDGGELTLTGLRRSGGVHRFYRQEG
ncbi:MAG: hypothetical protein HY928_10235 [Elusimicrobia bacterium]|nr:hypothetical protein [Elusimicrobiota bacterium]